MAEWIIKLNEYLSEDEILNNAQLFVNTMMGSYGWTFEACCGTAGNIMTESTFNPYLWESFQTGVESAGFGLVQWTPSTIITNWMTSHGFPIQDPFGQMQKINEEVTDGSQWIPTSSYPMTFQEYIKSTESPDYLANVFICNYERPATTNQPIRGEQALMFYNTLTPYDDKNSKIIQSAVKWACEIAEDDSHGYDQTNRWGVDYDCSSLIISAYEQAGLLLKSNGATYTGDMPQVALSLGFENVIDKVNTSTGENMLCGDIILASSHHVSMYVGNYKGLTNQVVSAHINELGEATGGETGDQTGHEIDISDYYTFSDIDYVLRLPHTSTPVTPIVDGEVYADILKTCYNIKQLSESQITFLKSLSYSSKVKMLFTFNRNKDYIGRNNFGKRLKFDDESYIIKCVENNGFIRISLNNSNSLDKIINPKYLKGDE